MTSTCLGYKNDVRFNRFSRVSSPNSTPQMSWYSFLVMVDGSTVAIDRDDDDDDDVEERTEEKGMAGWNPDTMEAIPSAIMQLEVEGAMLFASENNDNGNGSKRRQSKMRMMSSTKVVRHKLCHILAGHPVRK